MVKLTPEIKIELERIFVESFDDISLSFLAKSNGVNKSVISRLAKEKSTGKSNGR
jgi:hypothetical protein